MLVAVLTVMLGLLLVARAARREVMHPTTETLDRGLVYLIKHVTHEPTFAPPLPPRTRWPKGTTSTNADEVALASRLRALEPTNFEDDAPTTVAATCYIIDTRE